MPDPATPQPDTNGPSLLRLTQWHRRLALYLYLDDLIRGRRVLEVGCGDGAGAAFLAGRGASHVVGIDGDGEAIARGAARRHERVSLRRVDPAALAGGALGEERFDLVVIIGDVAPLRSDEALQELRRVLSPAGHLVTAARSKEATPDHPDALSYFELVSRLDTVGRFGPVAMLGQAPFLATTVVPFGVEQPELVMDDSLTTPEPPEEYVALCGPAGRARPYQVIQLPHGALEPPPGLAAPRAQAAPAVDAEALERLRREAQELRRERDALAGEAEPLRAAAATAAAERDRLSGELAQAAAARQSLTARLQEAEARLHSAEAQVAEGRELLQRREEGLVQQAEAARIFEEKLRQLRGALEERDAYAAELEAQARGVEDLRARIATAERRAEQAEQAERAARQRLAETEGALLRAQSELAAARSAPTPAPAPAPTHPGEATDEAFRQLYEERQALDGAQRALAEDRQALSRGAAEIEKLRDQLDAERQLAAQDREELQRLREQLERDRQALEERSGDVPVPVGDLPTAPHVSFNAPAAASPQEEVERLQARIAELEADNVKLKEKASEAERESWKYMKARSEAEAQAAEVRDDAAKKLRDARKLASVELTRAMEEATKKAVALREELTRTERERKDALAQVKELRAARDNALRQVDALRQEIEALRWSSALPAPVAESEGVGGAEVHREVARAREEGAAAVLAVRAEAERALADERAARQSAEEAERRANLRFEELRATVLQLELQLGEARDGADSERQRVETMQEEVRRLTDEAAARQREAEAELLRMQQDLLARDRSVADLRLEREALGRLLQEVEREAYSRAERARELRTRMLERDREVEALRVELLDRDRKITALEKQLPPGEEIVRLEADLQAARARLQELEAERGRQDAASDEAVATALRERARASRLTESLQQAARERDEAQNRVAELEQRLQGLLEERNRLRGETGRLEEIVRRAQAESQQLGDRLKQTRRELEAEEKRATREAERAQAAAELGRLLDEARGELAGLRVRTLELQAELAKSRAELARLGTDQGQARAAAPGITAETAAVAQATLAGSGAVAQDAAAPAPAGAPKAAEAAAPAEPAPAERSGPATTRTPVLQEHTVRRVLALGQALGLEPLHAPRPGADEEPAPPAPPKADAERN